MSGIDKASRIAAAKEAQAQQQAGRLDPRWPYKVLPFDPSFWVGKKKK